MHSASDMWRLKKDCTALCYIEGILPISPYLKQAYNKPCKAEFDCVGYFKVQSCGGVIGCLCHLWYTIGLIKVEKNIG